MDPYRFHVPDLQSQYPSVLLPPEEARHARTVLRFTGGETVELFDGQGASAIGPAQLEGKHAIRVPLQTPLTQSPPPTLRLTLATAVPKGDRADWLIEQASQLGVFRVEWLDCQRSIAHPGEGKMATWRRLAIESAKQSGRNHLLQLAGPTPLQQILHRPWQKILWLDPHAPASILNALTPPPSPPPGDIAALIGPEGGWTDPERDLLQQSTTPIRLNPHILRIETAATAAAAIIQALIP